MSRPVVVEDEAGVHVAVVVCEEFGNLLGYLDRGVAAGLYSGLERVAVMAST